MFEASQADRWNTHGLGRDLDAALGLAREVEALADEYGRTLQRGPPMLLDDAEMARVLEKFWTYGQQPREAED